MRSWAASMRSRRERNGTSCRSRMRAIGGRKERVPGNPVTRTRATQMNSIESLNDLFGAGLRVRDGRVQVSNAKAVATPAMDTLVRAAVFDSGPEKEHARWLIWEIA